MDDVKCPDCGSGTCIPWDDGCLYVDCGTEFDPVDNQPEINEEMEEPYA